MVEKLDAPSSSTFYRRHFLHSLRTFSMSGFTDASSLMSASRLGNYVTPYCSRSQTTKLAKCYTNRQKGSPMLPGGTRWSQEGGFVCTALPTLTGSFKGNG